MVAKDTPCELESATPSTCPPTNFSVTPGRQRRMAVVCIRYPMSHALSMTAISSGVFVERILTTACMSFREAFSFCSEGWMPSRSIICIFVSWR